MEWPLVGRSEQTQRVIDAIEGAAGSAILQGDLGVGKTRLARTVADALRSRGWRVELCMGSPAATPIPFGAFSHLLPQPSSDDLVLNLERMRREVVARSNQAPVFLVVDDANYLDHGSMALVHRLASARDAAVLATRRTGEPGNEETLTSLWKDGHAELFDVLPLDRASHDRLVVDALGSVRAAGLLDRVWQLTKGNPLFLRELLSASGEGGLDAWLDNNLARGASLTPTARLSEIIGSKTNQLPKSARAALEVVAMAEPVNVAVVAELSSRRALAELEDRSMVVIERFGAVEHAKTVHPLYGATIRGMLPSMRRAALAASLADALIAAGLAHAGDALRAAVWLEDAGRPLPLDLAVRAANEALARGDASLAERLAGAAAAQQEHVGALTAMGTALSVQHKPEARDVLERALRAATNTEDRVRAALACSRHFAWEGSDLDRGVALLEELIPAISDPRARSELQAELAFYAAAAGDAGGTVRVAQDVIDDPRSDRKAVLSAFIHSTRARTMLGWFDGLEADLDRAEELATELSADLPLAFDQLRNNRALYLRSVDLDQALRVARAGYEHSLAEGGPSGMWSGTLAWCSVDSGDLDGALGLIDRSGEEFERYDPFHNVLMHRSLAALVHAVRGETDQACHWLEKAGRLDDMEPRSRTWADRAAVWINAAAPDRAAELAIAAGERAEARTIITWGAALLYHDAARLGHAPLAVDALERLASATTAPLVAAMAAHARAAADNDAEGLVRVADEFARRGSPLFAAEALAQAAPRAGTKAAGDRLAARAVHLLAACPGAATPLVAGLVSPLSEREQEIARLAVDGVSSRDIAQLLFLSVRTVDNHLASVYKKLGLSGRQGLSSVFTSLKR